MLECVKDARMFAHPGNIDNYLDGINYRAFAALFADDYERVRNAGAEIAYHRKTNFRKAEMKPVEVVNKDSSRKRASDAMLADIAALNGIEG